MEAEKLRKLQERIVEMGIFAQGRARTSDGRACYMTPDLDKVGLERWRQLQSEGRTYKVSLVCCHCRIPYEVEFSPEFSFAGAITCWQCQHDDWAVVHPGARGVCADGCNAVPVYQAGEEEMGADLAWLRENIPELVKRGPWMTLLFDLRLDDWYNFSGFMLNYHRPGAEGDEVFYDGVGPEYDLLTLAKKLGMDPNSLRAGDTTNASGTRPIFMRIGPWLEMLERIGGRPSTEPMIPCA